MLIITDRNTEADLEAWGDYEEIDAAGWYSAKKEQQSIRVMGEFLERHEKSCVMVSWGKDSIAMLSMFVGIGINRPVVYALTEHRSNPDCLLVRDAFLAKHDIDYHEHEYPYEQVEKSEKHWADLHRRYGVRCSGIRNDESKTRLKTWERYGFSSKNSCRPLSLWTSPEVFSYIYHQGIPLSPVYGYLGGGRYRRNRIRTHSMHSIADQAGSGTGRLEWEREYYPDVLNRIQKYIHQKGEQK